LIVPNKRLKYFTHQFLREQDFEAEQAYHIAMRRLHNRSVHGWGIVDGLAVHKKSDNEIAVEPGIALDGQGREIVLTERVTRNLSSFERNSHTYVTIEYGESWEDTDRYSSGGIEGYPRITESPIVGEKKHEPAKDGNLVTLARVRINENGHVQEEIETGLRPMVGARSSAVGWVRMPFKPVRLELTRIGGKLVPPKQWDPSIEFIVDVASAYCEKSARGSMQIPIPPGASKLRAFRICGTTQGKVEVELVRGGWDRQANKGEVKQVLKLSLEQRNVNGESFYEPVEIREDLQHLGEWDTLSMVLEAEGRTDIWLVAARFE
jgi:hypothetical protein